MTFWEHIEQLRLTLLRTGLVIVCSSLLAFFFHQPLFNILLAPLKKPHLEKQTLIKQRITARKPISLKLSTKEVHLQAGESIDIEIPKKGFYLFSPLDGFSAVLKVSFWSGLLFSSPIWLFFLLRFITPALRAKERRALFPFLGLSVLFITLGLSFAYFITLPLVTRFFETFNEGIGENMWGLGQTLDFSLTLVLAHGLAFELYVGLLFLVHFDLLSSHNLRHYRPHVAVITLLLAALLTPPDLISQLLLALPMLLLYETALLYAKSRKKLLSL